MFVCVEDHGDTFIIFLLQHHMFSYKKLSMLVCYHLSFLCVPLTSKSYTLLEKYIYHQLYISTGDQNTMQVLRLWLVLLVINIFLSWLDTKIGSAFLLLSLDHCSLTHFLLLLHFYTFLSTWFNFGRDLVNCLLWWLLVTSTKVPELLMK